MGTADRGAAPLLVLLAPTGSGKSRLAIALAHRLDGEVIIADSMQVYRGFTIGTDKIPPEKQEGVPHHLIDIIDPEEEFSAGRYVALADEAIGEARGRGRVPIVTAGTGLYCRALIRGLFPGPARDPELRRVLGALGESRGWEELHRWLRRLDPETAARVPPTDRVRVVRGLEVALRTGVPLGSQAVEWRQCATRYEAVEFGLRLPREVLYRRIDARAAAMLGEGLLDEVRQLREQGVPEDANAFHAIGYREALRWLRGEWSEEQVLAEMQKSTRRYAKRQMTWFRRETGVRWVGGDRPLAELVEEIACAYTAFREGGTEERE